MLGKLDDDCVGGSSNGFASKECVEAKGFCVSSAEKRSIRVDSQMGCD